MLFESSLNWVLDRLFGSVVLFCVFFAIRFCWRSARANQKLALADALDYRHSERRSLLLPV
jgi:hypothetical protein